LTPGPAFRTLKAMEVHFAPELQAKLDRVAAENRRGADEYVQQLVENYLDHDAWFRQKVTTSLDKLAGGEFLAHEDVGARLQKMFQP
jgi:predicted transcriptional regulator